MRRTCNRDCFNCVYNDCIISMQSISPTERLESNILDKSIQSEMVSEKRLKKRARDYRRYHRDIELSRKKSREQYQKFRDKKLESYHKWYAEHKEEVSDMKKAYYLEHQEEIRAKERKRYQDNKEEINRKRRERYARKKLERSLADGNSRIEE